MPAGGKHGNIPRSRSRVYEALRRKGMSKTRAAKIANAGITKTGRKTMARKASKSRRKRR